jgi:hypothetical protein
MCIRCPVSYTTIPPSLSDSYSSKARVYSYRTLSFFKGRARRFLDYARLLETFFERDIFAGYARNWRVFPPDRDDQLVTALLNHLSGDDLEFALKCVRNGI